MSLDAGAALEPEVMDLSAVEAITRGEVDIQIATARRFPRSITSFQKRAQSLVQLTRETAESCIYALPRRDKKSGQTKMIKGPSIRFAEIAQSCYGNIRSLAIPIAENDGFVTVRGLSWDIEANSVIGVETRRRITGSDGRRYSDDMITMTVNAGSSIVLRNAILHCIPKPLWQPIYDAAVKFAVGDQKTLSERRASAIEHFKKMGVRQEQVFARLGVAGVADIGLEQLEELLGLANAIKDNEITIDDAFREESAVAATNGAALDAELADVPEAKAKRLRALFDNRKQGPGQALAYLRQYRGRVDELIGVLEELPGTTEPITPGADASSPAQDTKPSATPAKGKWSI